MEWQNNPGSSAAQAFIAQYPTPRDLRKAVNAHGYEIFTMDIQCLRWSERETVGQVLHRAGFSRADLTTLHTIIRAAAMDRALWRAPDGTITVN